MNHFQHQKLLSWRDYYNEFISPFLIKTISLEDQEVNLDLCIGTDHPNYINKTWYDLYQASGDGRAIFLATRSLFTFVVVTLFVLAYDVMDKTIKYCGS